MVNNNAAAVLLSVHALAAGGQVVVARSELVEIGGSFRIPEIVAAAGARLRLVGAANVVRLEDYREAVDAATSLILRVHRSNFRLEGHRGDVPAAELAALGDAAGVPVVEDLGSGTLVDLTPYGLPPEPTVAQALATGMALVTFSGDKLLGGPQAGVVAGRAALVRRLRRDHLLRSLRVGKVIDALLCETLDRYLDGGHLQIPFFRMLAVPTDLLRERAREVVRRVAPVHLVVEIVESRAQVGAGACPEHALPSAALAVARPGVPADELAARCRRLPVPVVGRIERDRLLLDLRSLLEEDLPDLAAGLAEIDA